MIQLKQNHTFLNGNCKFIHNKNFHSSELNGFVSYGIQHMQFCDAVDTVALWRYFLFYNMAGSKDHVLY